MVERSKMALVKIDILNHADYGGEFRKTPMAPGLSKFYSAIESIRSKNRDNCLLLDAGDNINRILWHGKEVMDGLALINTDCMTLGNHEFDKGRENLEECIEHICNKMDILCCNIVYKDSKQLIKNVKPYTIIEKNNIKYGIIGVTTSYTPYMVEKEAFSQFEVLDEYQQLMKYLPEVKKQSDLLIILAHMPFYFTDESESGDLIDLYYKIKQFKPDVMIGGHIPQDYCRVVDDCVICKGGFSGKSLPHCQLTYDTESKKVVDRKCEVIDVIHSDFEGDKTVDEFVKKVTSKYDYYFDEVLGVAKEEIDMLLSRESHLGNFICDQNAVNTRDSIILNLKITKHTDGSITIDNYDYVPIYMYKDSSVSKHKMKILDINKTIYNYEHNLDDSITEKIYNLMKTELDRITKILND